MPGECLSLNAIFTYLSMMIIASPGRFFASAELKALMAHVLLNYDVKLPNDSREVPPLFKFLNNVGPNQTAKALFRKRKTD